MSDEVINTTGSSESFDDASAYSDLNGRGGSAAATSPSVDGIQPGDNLPPKQQISGDPQARSLPRNDEERRIFNLDRLASEVRDLLAEGCKHLVLMALKVREARQHFEESVSGDISWADWVSDNLPFKVSRANQLLQIASAKSPEEELRRQLDLGKERATRKRARDKLKKAQSLDQNCAADLTDDELEDDELEDEEDCRTPPDDGGTVEEDSTADEPERNFLRDWVEFAPLPELRRVVEFLRSLGCGDEEYALLAKGRAGTDAGSHSPTEHKEEN